MDCEVCGKGIDGQQKRFCGHSCRSVWYSEHMADKRARPCVMCGTVFSSKGPRKTCSSVCRYNLLRKTFAERGIQPPPQSAETREASRQRMTGAGCPKFNGYRAKTGNNGAYIKVKPPAGYPFQQSLDSMGYIREHRMVVELSRGNPLSRKEVVHHVNGDTQDNRIENLVVFGCNGDHVSYELKGKPSNRPSAPCSEGCGRNVATKGKKTYATCRRCRSTAAYRASGRPDAINHDGKPWP